MDKLDLKTAQRIIDAAHTYARETGLQPLGVAVLDARSVLTSYGGQDGTSIGRAEIAIGKANGALSMGLGSRTLARRARDVPHFINAVAGTVRGGMVPVPGGVLIRNERGDLLGAAGISGDTSDNDEAAALAAIAGAGLVADPGAD
ncbi:MAG: heme-binding protein [Pseudomonadota bacterium]